MSSTRERARAMRAAGDGFAKISSDLRIGIQWAYKLAGDVIAGEGVRETRDTIVKHTAHNGGCSTLSGMRPVSMPRIKALHGELA